MPKKLKNTKSRKKTFAGMKRKRILEGLLRAGKIKWSAFIRARTMPLKSWKH